MFSALRNKGNIYITNLGGTASNFVLWDRIARFLFVMKILKKVNNYKSRYLVNLRVDERMKLR